MSKTIIVDTNILFSVLLNGNSKLAKILLNSEQCFFTCELAYIELFERKEKIIKSSHLTNEQVIELLYLCLRRINLFKENRIRKPHWDAAYQFM